MLLHRPQAITVFGYGSVGDLVTVAGNCSLNFTDQQCSPSATVTPASSASGPTKGPLSPGLASEVGLLFSGCPCGLSAHRIVTAEMPHDVIPNGGVLLLDEHGLAGQGHASKDSKTFGLYLNRCIFRL